jgi:hypothetical protein
LFFYATALCSELNRSVDGTFHNHHVCQVPAARVDILANWRKPVNMENKFPIHKIDANPFYLFPIRKTLNEAKTVQPNSAGRRDEFMTIAALETIGLTLEMPMPLARE